ncbi:MAG: ABC transporter permease [Bryobacterales bacterium]|nr:ABC transporter permease [Bryobacterales bacterium]
MARKEGLHILRDARSLIMALAVPVLMLLLFGYALTLDVDRIPTLIYDQDQTPQSRELSARLAGSRYFQILGTVSDYRAIQEQIENSRCLLAVVIPPDYSRNLLGNREADVQLILDGSDSNTASIALGYAEALVRAYAFELRSEALNRKGGGRLDAPVDAQLRVWFNSELVSRNYIVPGLIAVIMMIIAAMITSLTIAREWENGSMEQLLSTPVRAHEIVLGKMLAYFALGLADAIITIAVGVFLFKVPLRGSPLLLLATSCIFLVGVLFWGIFISAMTRNQLMAYQMGMLTSFLPAFLLSGFVFAIENMPVVIQVITYFFPSRYFITVLKGIFLKGVSVHVLWLEIVLLVVYAAVLFLGATSRLRRKMA